MSLLPIIEHIWVTLVPGLVGMAAGAVVGQLIARLITRAVTYHPGLRRRLPLVPWRTLLIALYPLTWGELLLVKFFGDASLPISIALTIFILAIPISTGLDLPARQATPSAVRILSTLRTLILLTVMWGAAHGGNQIGNLFRFALRALGYDFWIMSGLDLSIVFHPDYWQVFQLWSLVVAAVLALDLLFGVVEFQFMSALRDRQAQQAIAG